MTVTINGTTGVAGVDGTASTPAIQGNDTNTGIFFPAADTIAFAEGGAEVARFDSSGNLGIGTSSPNKQLAIGASGTATLGFTWTGDNLAKAGIEANHTTGEVRYAAFTNYFPTFYSNNTERMRIDSSGNLLVGTTSQYGNEKVRIVGGSTGMLVQNDDLNHYTIRTVSQAASASTHYAMGFCKSTGAEVGKITHNDTSTSYNTSSDYRLKENIAPMTGALAKVSALKPCTYTWKENGSDGQGFIAHELQAVVPECVVGEKDAVDAEGNPQYQGIDTSFLVATLTAAIQELNAKVDSLQAELATLKGQA